MTGIIVLWTALAQADPDPVALAAAGDRVERQQLGFLLGWSVGNLAYGVPAALATDGRSRTFHGSNAAWNTVNLGIATAGLVGTVRRQRQPVPSLADVRKRQRGLRTGLAVNLGLDAVYVGTGLALTRSDGSTRGVDHRGLGQALILQGAFLAVFDAVFLARHRRATRAADPGVSR
jgi:hypothetical protein